MSNSDKKKEINISFPDGKTTKYPCGVNSKLISENLPNRIKKNAIAARINGLVCDLSRPIENDAKIEIITFDDKQIALELIRHDCAHIMARAVQEIWPKVKVTIGPVIENGWYYDFDKEDPFLPEDLLIIEKKMKEIINKNELVKTEVWSREKALDYYKKNGEKYKIELINDIPLNEEIRFYWHGYWQDLCRGPHLYRIGQIPGDSFKLTKIAGAYWRGNSDNKMLQRIYGVAFKNRSDLKKYFNFLDEAKKRDHRKLGKEMSLFHLQEEAPGMIFWHPNGYIIYKELQDYIRRQQQKGGYVEVKTPQVVDRKLWERSGHWDKYPEHMFIVEVDEEGAKEKRINALKPMNCPCHVQIYNQKLKSYRDLPLRMAEFGSCHRYEPSGAMHGIMRVRGFVQDDAHIFCQEKDIKNETKKFITLLSEIYKDLGFDDFHVLFSDRPKIRSGSDEIWDKAEEALKSATEAANCEFKMNPGDGAFYGPKLEFVLRDAIGRNWQCGTIQVDFVLPEKLEASYINEKGEKKRPVILHRAILGSFERFIGILIEEFSGKIPTWLTPTQVVVASIVSDANDYAVEVKEKLSLVGVRTTLDIRTEQINYKIREHSLLKVPYILAVGSKEVSDKTVTVRKIGSKITFQTKIEDFLKSISKEILPPDIVRNQK